MPENPAHESLPSRSYCRLHWLESLCAALHSGAANLKMLLLLPKAMRKVITACSWLALRSSLKAGATASRSLLIFQLCLLLCRGADRPWQSSAFSVLRDCASQSLAKEHRRSALWCKGKPCHVVLLTHEWHCHVSVSLRLHHF